jgi:exosortase
MDTLVQERKLNVFERFKADPSPLLLAGVAFLVVVSFYSPFLWMLDQWFVVEEYSPGPAIPVLAAIAFWHTLKKNDAFPKFPRKTVRSFLYSLLALALVVYLGKEHPRLLPASGFLASASYSLLFIAMSILLLSSGALLSRSPSAQCLGHSFTALGLTLVLLSLTLHFFALRGDLPRASIVSYIALLFAISWFLYGWKTVRRLVFPYALLLFMVPVAFIDEIVGIPLRVMATGMAVSFMKIVGLQVVQRGTWFAVGSMEFAVNAPCSGLKSLIALTALGATFAYVTQPTLAKKILLGLCAIPIAILTNVVRLACVGIFAQVLGKDLAITLFHDHAAILLYALAIVIFISLDKKVFQAEWFKVKNF